MLLYESNLASSTLAGLTKVEVTHELSSLLQRAATLSGVHSALLEVGGESHARKESEGEDRERRDVLRSGREVESGCRTVVVHELWVLVVGGSIPLTPTVAVAKW